MSGGDDEAPLDADEQVQQHDGVAAPEVAPLARLGLREDRAMIRLRSPSHVCFSTCFPTCHLHSTH
eukprot:4250324-Lingulodinium_polyedra.AAC.1